MNPARTRETLIYLEIWRKAVQAPDRVLELPPLPAKTTALSLRMLLYRAIKPYRPDNLNPPTLDPDLRYAAENLQVAVEGCIVRISPRKTLAIVEGLLAGIGITEADIAATTTAPADSSLARIMEQMDAMKSRIDPTAPSLYGSTSNPFNLDPKE